MSVPNGEYWRGYFDRTYIVQLGHFREAIVRRVLPNFDSIEQEAQNITDAEFQHLMSGPYDPYTDPGALAEAAFERGLYYYEALAGVQQSMINLTAVALYHMFEQQFLAFHRKELLEPWEEDDQSLLTAEEAKKRLRSHGIDVKEFASWSLVDELRHVANTVKHGDGRSANILKSHRPELFIPNGNGITQENQPSFHPSPRVVLPLAGQDIYLTESHIEQYTSGLVAFWEELGNFISA